jgi:hypothetical protein
MSREVMQMALDWFYWFQHGTNPNGAHVLEVEEALRAALAQPDPEPVAQYSDVVSDGGLDPRNKLQREWVGLTDEERHKCWSDIDHKTCISHTMAYGDAIEAKLKEKNT